jgi:hypothetical protein
MKCVARQDTRYRPPGHGVPGPNRRIRPSHPQPDARQNRRYIRAWHHDEALQRRGIRTHRSVVLKHAEAMPLSRHTHTGTEVDRMTVIGLADEHRPNRSHNRSEDQTNGNRKQSRQMTHPTRQPTQRIFGRRNRTVSCRIPMVSLAVRTISSRLSDNLGSYGSRWWPAEYGHR